MGNKRDARARRSKAFSTATSSLRLIGSSLARMSTRGPERKRVCTLSTVKVKSSAVEIRRGPRGPRRCGRLRENAVFAYTASGDLIALNLASGKPLWTYALNAGRGRVPRLWTIVSSRPRTTARFTRSRARPAASNGTEAQRTPRHVYPCYGLDIYAGTADGNIYRAAASNGEVRASISVDSVLKPTSAPVVTKDAVLVLLADKEANSRAVVSLDPALARIKWRQDAPDRWTTSRIFTTSRTIFVGNPSGELSAYCCRRIPGMVRQAGKRADSVYWRNR